MAIPPLTDPELSDRPPVEGRRRFRAGERSLLRNRDFVRLWTAETVSQVGSQVSTLALPLLAITTLHATKFEVGALTAVEFAPFLIVGLPAGVIVDRHRRRPVLMLGDLGRAIALFSIPLAWWLGWLRLAQLFVVVFITGVLTVFFDVAYQSYLPALVDADQLGDGNAKLQVSDSGAQIAGPGLAGSLVQLVGAPVSVLADAISFVLSAASVSRIRSSEPPVDAPAKEDRASMRSQIAEGLRYVLGHPVLRGVAGCTATSNFFSSMSVAVIIYYLARSLHYRAGVIGLLFMIANLGFFIGATISGRVERALGLGRTIWLSILVGEIGGVVVGFSPRVHAFPWLAGGLLLTALGGPIYNIAQVSYRQAITPNHMLGRMNASMRFMVWGTMPLGALAGGVLGTVFGLKTTLIIAGIGGLLSVLFVLTKPVREVVSVA
jgi:MFS family permease